MESITWATANSMNVPAIRAMQFAGPQAVKELAERLGVTFLPTQSFGYSAAIGADEVTPLQMVNAYATFGNSGVRVPPQTILDIWNNNGQSLYHYDENNAPGVRVVSPQVAYEMTMALSDEPARTFEFDGDQDLSFADVNPTCQTSDICSVQLAAKTGTTDNFTDNWTIGYTPEVAVGVWVGNDNNSPLLHSIGITGAAPIFHSVMERVLGWCNYSSATQPNPNSPYAASEVDNIPCGQGGAYNFPFSGHPQLAFPNPGGVTQGYAGGGLLVKSTVSTDGNGLGANNPLSSGSGSQAIEYDWMLNGE
jgi:membrane peptidoglycan carboxypeptidase